MTDLNGDILASIDPDENILRDYYSLLGTCRYYTIEEYARLNLNENYNLSVINYNIRSFNANGTAFQSMLGSNSLIHDIVVLTETWNDSFNLEICKLDGYIGNHTYREVSRGGGVSIFCRNNFEVSKIEPLCFCNDLIESCAVKIGRADDSIIVIGIYRPHSGTVENYTTALETLLNDNELRDHLVIIAGDFNINLTDTTSDCVNNFSSAMNSLHYIPTITKPTRFPPGDANGIPTTLDHIWTNKVLNCRRGIIYFDVTDHCPSFTHIDCSVKPTTTSTRKIILRPFDSDKLNKLMDGLVTTNWDTLLNDSDIESACDSFTNYLNKQYCKYFPAKTKYLSNKRISNPWLTSSIKSLINQKSNYFKMYRMGIISKQTNNQMKNKINKEVNKAKSSYYLNVFNTARNDIRKSWEVIRNITGNSKNKEQIIKLMNDDGEILTDKTQIANSFIDFFTSIGNHLDSNLDHNNLSPCNYVTENPRSFYLFPVTVDETEKIISKMKHTKTDINVMPVKLFITLRHVLSYPISKLINLSFQTGIFPNSLKLARITPVFKQGDKKFSTNYRPISSLPYLSKIFERSMVNRLLSFFNKFSLLSESQFGFLKNKSTVDALIHLTESIFKSLNEKKTSYKCSYRS